MMGVNRVMLLGNLGVDPEIKKTNSGQSMTLFSLATSSAWTNREGQRQEHTEWHRVVVWGKLAETCAKYLTKGNKVYVDGRLQTRSWEDDKNQKRYTTEIVAREVLFLNSKSENVSSQNYSPAPEPAFGGNEKSQDAEDIPF
ncbi:MAG: single-stranded DNA-binding protein [Bdellovibrionales bacterium]|nr:single-stranded DNA-binding protein [Bdellovibrionales bacterium]